MANSIEIPRMPPIDERQEEKLAAAIAVDISASEQGYEKQIMEAIQTLKDAIMEDDMARARVEICLILFGTHADVAQNFTLASGLEVPTIQCTGSTATHEAIALALKMVRTRKSQYKDEKVAYKQPWIYLLTDGGSNDADNGSFEDLLKAQKNGECVFFGVAVGDDRHLPALGAMNKDGIYMKVSKDGFKEAFKYISQSITGASRPDFNNMLELPDEDSGIQVFQVKDRMLKL